MNFKQVATFDNFMIANMTLGMLEENNINCHLKDENIVTIDPAVLDNYIGKYKLNDNIIVTMTKENNKLFGEPTNQPKVELQPLSDTDFVIKELNAKISFVKDENGKVTKLKLNMNGMDSELPRIE